MRTTDTILKVLESRGKEGKPVERLYRQLFRPELYRTAYSQIYSNLGATTEGSSEDTLDGMSNARIDRIIEKVKSETYRWNPVRRTYIPKANGKRRPLGIPSGDDKLLQAVMKLLLEAYYEPQFSDLSHGFRPDKGCHTALVQLGQQYKAVSWFVEGDIQACFDEIDHEILLEIMGEKIKDGRFLRLIGNLLKAGYMEDWKHYDNLSGTPQGGIISPLLANIYMDVFDKWVETKLLPMYNRRQNSNSRKGRRRNPEYTSLSWRRKLAMEDEDRELAKKYLKKMQTMPSVMYNDEQYRKLSYIRYADDFILGFAGPNGEAEDIKGEIKRFLNDRLRLKLSNEKTLITHARTGKARFLGYDLCVINTNVRRQATGSIWFGIPQEAINKAITKYRLGNKIMHRNELIRESDYQIVSSYQSEYRGLVQYYAMAHNLAKLRKVNWATRGSLLKTLAGKYKMSSMQVKKKYLTEKTINKKTYKVIEVIVEREGEKALSTYYGGISLARKPRPERIIDVDSRPKYNSRSEIVERLMADNCEMCGVDEPVEMHHVRKLKDVNKPGRREKPAWVHRMAAIRRKTLAVCYDCHNAIHAGKHLQVWDDYKSG